MSTLDIRLFGAMEIRWQGELLTDFRSQKALALLAYLICADRPVTREYLAGLGWPDTEQSHALGLLRRTLHDLTSKLPDCLLVDRRTVHFAPTVPITIDVRTFADLMLQNDATAWAQAVELYRASFLEGVYIDNAPELENWLSYEQHTWQQQVTHLLDRLITQHSTTAAYADALRYARRLVVLEPWREEAHRQVMLLLMRNGQLSAALAQYHRCRQILWAELAVEPAQSTQALYVRLQGMARQPVYHLPMATTRFVGREAEVADLSRLLATPHCRLITLLGVGGIGKTRLALAVAHQVVGDAMRMFLHGAVFVPLAGVDTGAQLLVTIAQALGLALQGTAAPADLILNHLRDKELLLILDNMEQLLDEPSLNFLAQVLAVAPEVKLLVTSRARLGLHSEQRYLLQGLHVPPAADITLANAGDYSALHLWLETTRRHDPAYVLTKDDLPALVSISQQVQGVPLALELAAAWHGLLSPLAIANELTRNLNFLTTSAPDLPLRQRSMRAVFQTSWRLLTPTEQQVFPRLAVFRGGFRAELALAAADADPTLLHSLVDKSLVNCSETGRYHLHEMIRQFAGEQLVAVEQLRTIRHRHALALLAFLQQITPQSRYCGDRPGIAAITVEYENLQAALQWCFSEGEGLLGLELVAALRDYWYLITNVQEGRAWQEKALALPLAAETTDQILALRAIVLNEWGLLLGLMAEGQRACEAYQESLRIFEKLGDVRECAWTLFHLARPDYHQGDNATCDALLGRALAIFRQIGDERGLAAVLQRLTAQRMDADQDLMQAEQLALESLAIARRLDLRGTIAGTLILLGELATRQGALGRAEIALSEGLSLSGAADGMRAWALGKLGRVLLLNGKPHEAEQSFQEALQIRQEMGSLVGVAWMLEGLGEVAVATGNYVQAVQMLSVAHTLRASRHAPLSAHEQQIFDQLVQQAHAAVGADRFALTWQKGTRLAQEQTDFTALFGAMPQP